MSKMQSQQTNVLASKLHTVPTIDWVLTDTSVKYQTVLYLDQLC